MFQAWQQVKVINESSGYVGQAGVVVRSEKQGDGSRSYVRLDADGSVQPFDESELQYLGG